ncbi:hypothetical protein [Prevotella koreensis]|uniref:hypothetical protein n=1 Tax=Prevotella koreensis TaxID=2490854 RepID=UPI0028E493F0|nr:hypothetical protein [Prevotella koreensis]
MEYILNGVNFQTLIMMLSDAPRYVDDNRTNPANRTNQKGHNETAEEEAEDIVGFFQSNLKG